MSSALSLNNLSAHSNAMFTSSLTSGMWTRTRTPSVNGGAGGYGTRVSQASVSISGSHESYDAVINNEKVTMQNLNDRLACYLDKVRSLESSNKKLELQIREYHEKRTHSEARDYSAYFATIADLKNKIAKQHLENQSINLQMDNAQLTVVDFKLKGEMEMNLRTTVEADVARLRVARDGLTLTKSNLEMQIEGLKEELIYMKNNHAEELRLLPAQQRGTVNVEVDSAVSVDLTKVLTEVRQQYEALMEKNKLELEKWFQTKVQSINIQITTTTEEVKSYHHELSELKKTYQSYEISRESALSEIRYMQQNLEQVQSCYSMQLTQLQMNINALEVELQQLRVSIERQQSEYTALLDIKMRLEMEIEEYRRLLGVELEKTA